MKRMIKFLFFVITCTFSTFAFTGCKKEEPTVYTVEKKDFYYSVDNGATYGKERVELEVGKTIFMKVIITIQSNKEKENISVSLTIPNIKAVDAYYIRGQKLTPTVDGVNNVTSYNFNITTNEEWIYIFEFSPSSEARVQMTLDFDEPIPDNYDSVYTIKFVNPKEE